MKRFASSREIRPRRSAVSRPFVISCDNCGFEGARARRATRSYGEGSDLRVVEGIPIVSCPKCGESYMTAEVLHQLERPSFVPGPFPGQPSS